MLWQRFDPAATGDRYESDDCCHGYSGSFAGVVLGDVLLFLGCSTQSLAQCLAEILYRVVTTIGH